MPKNQTKIRAQRVAIDLPTELAMPWVQVVAQTVIRSHDRTAPDQVIDRTHALNRALSHFQFDQTTVADPVTGENITASGAGIAMLIKQAVIGWMQQDIGGEVNDEGDLIIDGPLNLGENE